MIQIRYLFHSGFTIETETDFIIFDYFKDNCIKTKFQDCGQLNIQDFPVGKKITFFVTHCHYDHFDKEIFTLVNNAYYVISSDVKVNVLDNIKICNPYEKFSFNGIYVETFGSTDEGLSFLITIDNMNIFHAGDLNWWHWEGETPSEQDSAKKMFFTELEKIKGKQIDIAFFPVDPRLDKAFYWGGKEFIEYVHPKVFIPMHFQDSYTITTKFKKLIEKDGLNTKVVNLTRRGEIISL